MLSNPCPCPNHSSDNAAPAEPSGLIVQCGMREPENFAACDKTRAHLLVMPDNVCEAEFDWRDRNGAKKTLWLEERHAVFIPRNTSYEIHWKRTAACVLMALGHAFVTGAATRRPVTSVHIRREWELAAVNLPAHFLFDLLGALCRRIRFPGTNPDVDAASRLLAGITITILSTKETGASSGLPVARMKRVQAYIENNLGERISAADLAREAGFGSRYFAKLFKISTGMPPRRYVLLKRLEHAQQLRADKNMQAADAAAATGFTDQSHMNHSIQRLCREGRESAEKAEKLPAKGRNLQSTEGKSGQTGAMFRPYSRTRKAGDAARNKQTNS